MKLNSISLKFSDLSQDSAKLEVLVDPPLEEGQEYNETDFEEQPCIALASRVMQFLSFVKAQENLTVEEEDGGSGEQPTSIH